MYLTNYRLIIIADCINKYKKDVKGFSIKSFTVYDGCQSTDLSAQTKYSGKIQTYDEKFPKDITFTIWFYNKNLYGLNSHERSRQ